MAESNRSLPPGGWLNHLWADCLYTRINLGPMLGNEYKNFLLFSGIIAAITACIYMAILHSVSERHSIE